MTDELGTGDIIDAETTGDGSALLSGGLKLTVDVEAPNGDQWQTTVVMNHPERHLGTDHAEDLIGETVRVIKTNGQTTLRR